MLHSSPNWGGQKGSATSKQIQFYEEQVDAIFLKNSYNIFVGMFKNQKIKEKIPSFLKQG